MQGRSKEGHCPSTRSSFMNRLNTFTNTLHVQIWDFSGEVHVKLVRPLYFIPALPQTFSRSPGPTEMLPSHWRYPMVVSSLWTPFPCGILLQLYPGAPCCFTITHFFQLVGSAFATPSTIWGRLTFKTSKSWPWEASENVVFHTLEIAILLWPFWPRVPATSGLWGMTPCPHSCD